MAKTPLQRQLDAGPPQPRPTPLDALAMGTRWFNEGRRIDIQALAGGLGASRVTVHRWVGTREQLLTEIMWSLTATAIETELQRLSERTSQDGRVADVMAGLAAKVVANRGVRRMQAEELELLTRLTTSDVSSYQQRLIGRVRQLLAEDHQAGQLRPSLDLDDLAFAVVRLTESFVHTPAITGNAPAPERVGSILHALLDHERGSSGSRRQ